MVATAEGRRRRKAGRRRRKKPLICPPASPARPGAGAAGRRGTAGGREQGDGRHGVPPGALSGRPATPLPARAGRRHPASREQPRRRDRGEIGSRAGGRGRYGRRGNPPAAAQPSARQQRPMPSSAGCSGGEATAAARLAVEEVSPVSSPRPGPAPAVRRAGVLSAPPAARRLPKAARFPAVLAYSQQRYRGTRTGTADDGSLLWRCPRRPFGRARERERGPSRDRTGPPAPSGCQPPGAECAQSLESSSPCLALRLRWARAPRICGVQGPRRSAAGGRLILRSVPRSLRPRGRHGTPTGATGRADRPKAAIDWTAARLQRLRSAPVARGRHAAAAR